MNTALSALVEVDHVRQLYPKGSGENLLVLDDVSLSLRKDEIVSLLGRSGCGKSSLLRIIAGLMPASQGKVSIGGRDVAGPAQEVAMVFQTFALFPWLTVLENVEIGAERPGNTLIGEGGDDALTERAMSALTFVGLGARANELISSFSYGHQRLIEIARALAANPTLLLLDEPAAGLNSSEKLELHELLKRIAAQGLTILIIDHDMTLVSEAAQHITVLNFGRRIADGESMAVLRHPDVVSAYLGTE